MKKKRSDRRSGFIKFLLSFFAAISVAGIGVAVGTEKGYSASVDGFQVEGLNVDCSGTADYSEFSSTGTTLISKVQSQSDSCSGEITQTINTIKFTVSSEKNQGKILYTISIGNDGTYDDSEYGKIVKGGDSITVTHSSNKDNNNWSTLTISNIRFVEIYEYETTFASSTGGDFTVSYNGTFLEKNTAYKNSTEIPYKLIATPDENYSFYGWCVGENIFEGIGQEIFDFTPDKNTIVFPLFRSKLISSEPALFAVGTKRFTDLNEAILATDADVNNKIIVVSSGFVSNGNYTIPSKVTLLVPKDSGYTYSDTPNFETTYSKPSPFVILTLNDNATLNFSSNSTLFVDSNLAAIGQVGGHNGTPNGPHGKIVMNVNSTINMNNGSSLYCWGYIVGDGTINASSGSNVYETMMIRDFRGGTCTSGMLSNEQKVFPFNQYYVQNIESHLKLYAGANETLSTAITIDTKLFGLSTTTTSFKFVSKDEGLFRMTSGYIEKYYDSVLDRIHFVISDGKASISPITVTVYKEINSQDYIMPIHSGLSIDLINSTVTTNQDLAIFPGATINIDKDSTFTINNDKNVYVYDISDCGSWFPGSNLKPLDYIGGTQNEPTRKYIDPVTNETITSVPDAMIDVNGTINVQNGHFYTTNSGACVKSSNGSGIVDFSLASDASNIYQLPNTTAGDIENTKMPVVNARLKNDSSFEGTDEEYTDLEAGTSAVMVYDADQKKWVREEQKTIDVTLLFKDETNTSNSYSITYKHPTEATGFTFPTAEEAGFAADSLGRIVIGWIDKENGNLYEPGDELSARYEEAKTFYAYYGNSWVNINNGSSWNYSYDFTSEEKYPEGLVQLPSPDGTTTNWYLFEKDSKGKLSDSFNSAQGTYGLFHYDSSIYAHGNDKYYFIQNGVLLEEEGVRAIIVSGKQTDYCYISSGKGLDSDGDLDSDGGLKSYVLTSTRKYIANDLGSMSSGFYNIDANGIIHTEDPYVAGNNACYSSDDTVAYGHGLFAYNGYYYYAKEDGSIVKSSSTTYETFYVYRTNNKQYNGANITAGLYCFDSDGRMLDPTTLKPMEAAS